MFELGDLSLDVEVDCDDALSDNDGPSDRTFVKSPVASGQKPSSARPTRPEATVCDQVELSTVVPVNPSPNDTGFTAVRSDTAAPLRDSLELSTPERVHDELKEIVNETLSRRAPTPMHTTDQEVPRVGTAVHLRTQTAPRTASKQTSGKPKGNLKVDFATVGRTHLVIGSPASSQLMVHVADKGGRSWVNRGSVCQMIPSLTLLRSNSLTLKAVYSVSARTMFLSMGCATRSWVCY